MVIAEHDHLDVNAELINIYSSRLVRLRLPTSFC